MKANGGSESEPFRKLSKNDVFQTTDQWKRQVLQKLGETSGVWVSYVREGAAPSPHSVRPKAPVKPSNEAIMSALKRRIRDKEYMDAVAADPKLPETKKAEDFPLPDDERAWEEYEALKFLYEERCREYQRQ